MVERLRQYLRLAPRDVACAWLVPAAALAIGCAAPAPPLAPPTPPPSEPTPPAAASSQGGVSAADCGSTQPPPHPGPVAAEDAPKPPAHEGACPAGDDEGVLEEDFVAEGELLPGQACTAAPLPQWRYTPETRLATLEGNEQVQFEIPVGWEVIEERRELLVVRGALEDSLLRPTFELFVSPQCDSVKASVTHARLAARALLALKSPLLTQEAVAKGRWDAALGNIGDSVLLDDVAVDTYDGPRILTLYLTRLFDHPSYRVNAAAACPGPLRPIESEGACQKAYRHLLGL